MGSVVRENNNKKKNKNFNKMYKKKHWRDFVVKSWIFAIWLQKYTKRNDYRPWAEQTVEFKRGKHFLPSNL